MKKAGKAFKKGVTPFLIKEYGKEKADAVLKIMEKRYEELCAENESESKAAKNLTQKDIYTSIAVFEAQLSCGADRKKAAKVIWDYLTFRSTKSHDMYASIFRIPFLYKTMPYLFVKTAKMMYGPEAGFKAEFYDTGKNEARFDMTECLYDKTFRKYGCSELTRCFCHTDDVCNSNIHPNLVWERTQTIGEGGTLCDFCMREEK